VEFRAQLFFAASHLSIVALVIVAAQMQDAVENQDLDFFAGGVSERSRIVGGNFRRDGDVARVARLQSGQGWKRQHVGGLIFAAEATVEFLEFGIRSNQDIDVRAQSGSATGASYKAVERLLGQTHNAFLQNDQGDPESDAALGQRP